MIGKGREKDFLRPERSEWGEDVHETKETMDSGVPEGPAADGVSAETVRHIADLIRLQVDSAEVHALECHFHRILEHFSRLRGLDLAGVQPFTPGVEGMLLREDVETPWEERGLVLGRAPRREGDFFRVPRLRGADGGGDREILSEAPIRDGKAD